MSTPRLPVIAISLEAYWILFRNFGAYLRLSWLPFLILVATSVGMRFYYRDVTGLFGDGDIVLGVASSLVLEVFGGLFEASSWLVTVPVATAWTRMVLLNSGQRVSLAVGLAEALYLLRYICLVMLFVGLGVLLSGLMLLGADAVDVVDIFDMPEPESPGVDLSTAILIIAFFAAGFALMRFMLALPAAAVGDSSRLRDSFALTKGRMLALFAVLLLTSAPDLLSATALIVWIDDMEFGAADGLLQAIWMALQGNAAAWLFFPLSVGALALAYRHLGGTAKSSPAPAADPA